MTIAEQRRKLLEMLSHGKTNTEIGVVFGVGARRVEQLLGHDLYPYMGVGNVPANCKRTAAVAEGFRRGMIA